ncbi:hypothetical protein MHU86_17131 [Fragilaria crotonensis]|nr:hypothetical protein MHU86_17131 [Fragilaria crotonensis]
MKKSHSNGIVYTGVDVNDHDEDLAFAEAVTVETSATAYVNVKHDAYDSVSQDKSVFIVDVNAVTVLKNDESAVAAHGTTGAAVPVPMASMNIASGSNLEDGVPVTGHHIHVKGEIQPSEYRDAWATVLFLMQCLAMVGVAIACFPYIGQIATVVSANTTTTPPDADDGSWLDFCTSCSSPTELLEL